MSESKTVRFINDRVMPDRCP